MPIRLRAIRFDQRDRLVGGRVASQQQRMLVGAAQCLKRFRILVCPALLQCPCIRAAHRTLVRALVDLEDTPGPCIHADSRLKG
ncbi:hypothetical protein BZL54_01280 [Burkholderia ubonensis subsp. mesacidophila]|uniref:Uncharacterized protein n=1 Tax=Burkholderia ubonensis subsp. mesacidophila TaxID=265293 RepID=A0A2A4FM75_9BURK|nr:hypothetical protein BZL54_01280 [Burkholderia ubonensis subsp. mesacidophila]